MSATYVTTPIYYVNDRPHIGHAYSTVAADLCCRYARLRGAAAWLLTGTDEHGQKVERRAREEGLEPQDFVDRMLPPFRALPALMHCDIDDFIRTTEPRHKRAVQALWQRLEAAGDIYLGEYEGWYSVHSEAFYTEKDLLDGKLCPVSKKPVERVKEKSYFFRLSKYTEPLLQHYEAHPDFVQPVGRFNEVKRFVAEGLHDLSISRTSFRWGVPVASCPEHVMYVWLDALTNYLSALGAPAAGETTDPRFAQWWPPAGRAVHIVGKDILRFHAVYWPAFLLSAGLPLPTQVWAHGWLTVNGEKMSKSSGNFIPPDAICNALGADVLRYYLMREVAFGQDGDFSHPKVLARYHGDLGNGLGNLLQRMLSGIVAKHLDGRVPIVAVRPLEGEDKALAELAQDVAGRAAAHYAAMAPQRALEAIWELVFACNRYVDQMAPWALAKAGDKVRLGQVCYHVLETLRWLSVMLWPCMPEKADALRQQLGLGALLPNVGQDVWPSVWGGLGGGGRTQPGPALFPRFEGVQEQELLARMGYVDAAQAAVEAKAAALQTA
ncbi:MAG: methionine--tRNA ligase, partial [Polyangiales bacterium]